MNVYVPLSAVVETRIVPFVAVPPVVAFSTHCGVAASSAGVVIVQPSTYPVVGTSAM